MSTMSSDPKPNIQEARERVTRLAREIEALSNAGGPADVFFVEFSKRLIGALGAVAIAVWARGQQGISLLTDLNLSNTGFGDTVESRSVNDKLLSEVLQTGQASVVSPASGPVQTTPTSHVQLLAPLSRGKDVVGVVQVFHRPDAPREAYAGYLQFMEQMCGHASRFLQLESAQKAQVAPSEFWQQFERFVLQMNRGRDTAEVAGIIANDGRQLLQADRVAVALTWRKRSELIAVSGTESVNRRSNQVRWLEKVITRVSVTGEAMWYTGQADLPLPIREPLAEYLHESNSRLVAIIPLFRPTPLVPIGDTKNRSLSESAKRPEPFAALIVEQTTDSRPKPGLKDRVALMSEHASACMANAWDQEQIFLLPLWRLLGRWVAGLRGSAGVKWASAVIASIVLILAMVLVPWSYRVEAKGRLMPTLQYDVFAPNDGDIVEVFVKSGQLVEAGEKLLLMRNEDLQSKLLASSNTLNEKLQLQQTLQQSLSDARDTSKKEQITEIEGRIHQTAIEVEGERKQLNLLTNQFNKLTVTAPKSGRVATFQVEQLLRGRPVQRGELLLEVMDETSRWRLELELPDYRMGHMLRRQQVLGRNDLPVEFLIATSSETAYTGHLDAVANRSVLEEQEGSIVEVYVNIAPADEQRLRDSDQLRIGAESRGKIDCGLKPLGYVLFGDVIEFVQKRLLLW